jgi:hypothetical protein
LAILNEHSRIERSGDIVVTTQATLFNEKKQMSQMPNDSEEAGSAKGDPIALNGDSPFDACFSSNTNSEPQR